MVKTRRTAWSRPTICFYRRRLVAQALVAPADFREEALLVEDRAAVEAEEAGDEEVNE